MCFFLGDNAHEYLSHQVRKFMASNGILYQISPYTLQQNEVSNAKTDVILKLFDQFFTQSSYCL